MEDQILALLQQMSQRVGQMETTLELKFSEQERALSRLDNTLSKVDEKLDANTAQTLQHESKIQELTNRLQSLEANQKWLVTLILGALVSAILAKLFGI